MNSRRATKVGSWSGSIFGVLLCADAASAQANERVSVDSNGLQAASRSDFASISADGRFVCFRSYAWNLVVGDTNDESDVFVRDRVSGTTTRVSVDSNGAEADNGSLQPSMSTDGRFVAFKSSATSLVAADTNAVADIFVRDRQTGVTTRVSVDSSSAQSDGMSAYPSLSPDGRFVVFKSAASNLVAGDTNGFEDVFVHDRQTGATSRISVDSTGAQGNADSELSTIHDGARNSISADGRLVVFWSFASNLVSADTNGLGDAFVHDRQSGVTTRVSVDSGGAPIHGGGQAPTISADGRIVAFRVQSSGNVTGGAFVHDLQTAVTTEVSAHASGQPVTSASLSPSLSSDGRYVVLWSGADLDPGIYLGGPHIFLHDRQHGITTLVSRNYSGIPVTGDSYNPTISADGRYIAFESDGQFLVNGDSNHERDVFVVDRGVPPVSYCTAGITSNGCQALMSSSGTPSDSADSGFVLIATGVEGQRQGILFHGVNGQNAAPWGGGSSSYLCVSFPVQRLGTQNSLGMPNACDGSLAIDWNAYMRQTPSALGNPLTAGVVVNAQAWFRDPSAPTTTNLSNGLQFTVGP